MLLTVPLLFVSAGARADPGCGACVEADATLPAGAIAQTGDIEAGQRSVGWLFDTSGFPRRWECGEWSAALGWLHIVSDVLIWAAYMLIPLVLFYFVMKRRTPLPGVTWLFIAFIASCGIGHLLEAVIFWEPVYRLAGSWKAVTAVASCATAIAMIPVVPRVLHWPSLAEINVRLENEARVREAAEQELLRLNTSLREANAELKQYVRTASHELKSPLVTISGYLGYLERDLQEGKDDEAPDHLRRIGHAVTRMQMHIDDLLDLSRIGHQTGRPVMLSIGEQVEDMVREHGVMIAERGAEVEMDLATDVCWCDRFHLGQVLSNLIGNAVRYGVTERSKTVIVRTRVSAPGWVEISVVDRGPGVDPRHHESVFELFQRHSGEEDGTGIGLAIVRRVAEIYGGSASVRETEGGGATFAVTLPSEPLLSAASLEPDVEGAQL